MMLSCLASLLLACLRVVLICHAHQQGQHEHGRESTRSRTITSADLKRLAWDETSLPSLLNMRLSHLRSYSIRIAEGNEFVLWFVVSVLISQFMAYLESNSSLSGMLGDGVRNYETTIQRCVVPSDAISTRLDDIGGMQSVKQDVIDCVILPLKNPHLFFQPSGPFSTSRGLLLTGPPMRKDAADESACKGMRCRSCIERFHVAKQVFW